MEQPIPTREGEQLSGDPEDEVMILMQHIMAWCKDCKPVFMKYKDCHVIMTSHLSIVNLLLILVGNQIQEFPGILEASILGNIQIIYQQFFWTDGVSGMNIKIWEKVFKMDLNLNNFTTCRRRL